MLEWQLILLCILGSLVFLMLTGMPVAFCFMLINVAGMWIFFGGPEGLEFLIDSMQAKLNSFTLLPVPLFILMGEIMFHSGIAPVLVTTIDKWIGKIPGRLSLLAVSVGTLFSTLTGTSLASVAMLGSALVPQMEEQGYKKPMSLGPILGSGGLAMMIPPSALAVLCGAIAEVSIGKVLLAIILPGLLMAVAYSLYIIARCMIQPDVAPPYDPPVTPLSEKISATVKYVLPQGLIVFLVVGVIFLGVATPSEAAATGAVGTIILSVLYGRMNWKIFKDSILSTLSVTGMVFLIIAGAAAFSQILSFSGSTMGLTELATNLEVSPIVVVIIMQIIVIFLGGFMDTVAIMMITLPIFIPIIKTLGFNPIWFVVLFLINIEMAGTSPPFGLSLFVMKGVAPKDTTMGDIYKAALPFLGCDLVVMALIMALPGLALWLPGQMS